MKRNLIGIVCFISFCLLLFAVSTPTEARDYHIRASDGEIYTVTLIGKYVTNPSLGNFSIRNISVRDLDGEMLRGATEAERKIATELYSAALLFSNVISKYNPESLQEYENWEQKIDEMAAEALKNLKIRQGATFAGGVFATIGVGALMAKIKVLAIGTAALSKVVAVRTSIDAAEQVASALSSVNSWTAAKRERKLLIDAAVVAQVAAREAERHQKILRNFWDYEIKSAVIPITEVDAAWESFYKMNRYGGISHDLVYKYILTPGSDLKERLGKYFRSIAPTLHSSAEVINSVRYTDHHLGVLADLLQNMVQGVNDEESAWQEERKRNYRTELDDAGFFQPRTAKPIRDVQLSVESLPLRLNVREYFSPNGDNLTYTPRSDNPRIAAARILSPESAVVIVTPKGLGSTSIAVELRNFRGLTATQRFNVTVTRAPAPNQEPQIVGSVPDQTLRLGKSPSPLDMSSYFRDPEGSTLTYQAWSNPTGIVRLERAGAQITITPVDTGSTTVVVRATDPSGLRAFQRISVTVERVLVVPPAASSQGFERGDAIVVQNAAPSVLNVRGGPGLAWGKKGHAVDGATGTLTDGPVSKNGFVWWKIRWDSSNKIVWTRRPSSNEAWSVEAIDQTELLAPRPPNPSVESFDLAIQSLTVNKSNLSPNEYFTLNLTIRNNGNSRSAASNLSYYHSSVQGRTPTDPPRLQGTVSLDPIAPGRRITKAIRLRAPSTHRTYYYGAWLNTAPGDTDINNNYATEVPVIVTPPRDQISQAPDLIVESISADKVVLDPGERFRLEVNVRNQGEADAASTYLRYYRSSDSIISSNDTEVGDDRMTTPDAGKTYDRWENLTAPNTPGTYYYGACVDSVTGESNVNNNCSEAIAITVQPLPEPDLVVASIAVSKATLAPGERFVLSATVRNVGMGEAPPTTLRYYRHPNGSSVGTDRVDPLTANETSDQDIEIQAPDEVGTFYYEVCIDGVKRETDVYNNCSIRIAVTVGSPENRVPVVVGTIPARALAVDGASESVDISGVFQDPDGDSLTYTAHSDDTDVATASVSGTAVTLMPEGIGSATITVIANDGALTMPVRFDVTVAAAPVVNRVPIVVGTIPARALTVDGASESVDISGVFQDPDGDSLTYTAHSDDTDVVTASVSGTAVTLMPEGIGSATITVIANDGALTMPVRFDVTVAAAPVVNRVPIVVGTIPARALAVDGASESVDISDVFQDPDGDSLTYTAHSDDTDVVTASVSGTAVTLMPEGIGSATITVIANDGALTMPVRFDVTVAAAPVVNRVPIVVGTIPARALAVDGASESVDISDVFQDPDGDSLTYTAHSDDTDVVTASVSGTAVTLTPQGAGSAAITVTANDGALEVQQNFSVTVTGDQSQQFDTPLTVQSICDRTRQIVDDILDILDAEDCADLGGEDLISITWLAPYDMGIKTLKAHDFQGLLRLEELDVSQNSLRTLPAGVFDGLTALLELDVSENSLRALPVGIFDELTALLDLYLYENSLSSLPVGVFNGLTALKQLYLEGNSLSSLPAGVFNGLTALTRLHLEENSLSSLPAGVFDGLTALKQLYLEENSLSSLPVGAFDGLTALEKLDLYENSLRVLPAGIFDGLTALEDLDLSENSLRTLPAGVFDGLTALEKLYLDDNFLSPLPAGIFDDALGTLTSLEVDDALKTTFGFSTTVQDAAEGDTVTVTVNLERPMPTAVRIPYTIGGTATTADYSNLQPANELLFRAGETSKKIVFTLLEDADTTPETVLITLADLDDVKLRKSDGSGSDSQLSAYDLLTRPQPRTHNVTVTTNGEAVSRPMYWTAADQKIRRSKLDGSQVQVLYEAQSVHGIALDISGGKMYWSEEYYWSESYRRRIRRANLDGSNVVDVVTDLESARNLALDVTGGKIYWVGYEKIHRANLNGSRIEDLVIGLDRPKGFALDVAGGKMYWTDTGSEKIQRANLNGSRVEDLVTGLDYPACIALDVSSGKMYWIDDDDSPDKIQRANLNGTDVEDLVTNIDIFNAYGLALDVAGGKMYWGDGTNSSTDRIHRANLDGTQIEQLYTGRYPKAIALAIEPGEAGTAAPLAVRVSSAAILPAEAALLPNYPNPFNPETWIPYQLAEPAEVTLRIYTSNGALVRALDLGHQPAGNYQSKGRAAYWDGRNELGERVASGLYFYTFTAGEFTATRKMLIRK